MEYLTLAEIEKKIKNLETFNVLIDSELKMKGICSILDKITLANQSAWDAEYRGLEGKLRLIKNNKSVGFEFGRNGRLPSMHWTGVLRHIDKPFGIATCDTEEME